MSSFIIKKIPPFTAEELEEIEKLSKMNYDEIDLSDIPESTDEELSRMKANRLRRKNLKIAG